MDVEAERQKLEDQKRFIEAYIDHPLSQEILRDNVEEQDAAINLICNVPVDSIQSFFAHFEACGFLHGLRRSRSITTDSLETIKQQLKEIAE